MKAATTHTVYGIINLGKAAGDLPHLWTETFPTYAEAAHKFYLALNESTGMKPAIIRTTHATPTKAVFESYEPDEDATYFYAIILINVKVAVTHNIEVSL